MSPSPLQDRMLMDSVLCRSRTGNHDCSELMSTTGIACLKDTFLSTARQPLALTIFMFSYRLIFIFEILCIHGCVYAVGYAYMTVCVFVCGYACISVHVGGYAYMTVCLCVWLCVHKYACGRVCIHDCGGYA